MLEHDFTPLFKLEHMLKDVGLVPRRGPAAGAPFPFAALARELYARGDRAAGSPSRTSRPCSRRSRDWPGTALTVMRPAVIRICRSFAGIFGNSRSFVHSMCRSFGGHVVHRCDAGATRGLRTRRSQVRGLSLPTSLSMPIAFKEWAVTVRALAEGEQLVTLRKGGIREPDKHFALDHERFFLYPDVRPPAGRLRARVAPARDAPRARGGRVGGRRAAAARADARRRDRAARPGADPRLGRGRRVLDGDGPARGRRAVPVLRVDAGLRREAARVEAPPSAPRAAAAHLPHPAAGDRQGARRLRRLPLLAGDHARPAVRGHARCCRTRSSSGPPRRSPRIAESNGVPAYA